ncbi:MAG: FmdB family transcriptional regulator [Actinobacteria bacterium]|jgi:predicted nucleic acid-binding Zn ribbon protein|nr:FmdB family transcriptional regulator [Actinomycetota bacterium]
MPTYVYRFLDTGETIEIRQSFDDEPLTEAPHPSDGRMRPVKKVFTPVGITFKGSGFYKTDSGSGSKTAKSASDSSGATNTAASGGTTNSSTSSAGDSGSSSGSASAASTSTGASGSGSSD